MYSTIRLGESACELCLNIKAGWMGRGTIEGGYVGIIAQIKGDSLGG